MEIEDGVCFFFYGDIRIRQGLRRICVLFLLSYIIKTHYPFRRYRVERVFFVSVITILCCMNTLHLTSQTINQHQCRPSVRLVQPANPPDDQRKSISVFQLQPATAGARIIRHYRCARTVSIMHILSMYHKVCVLCRGPSFAYSPLSLSLSLPVS